MNQSVYRRASFYSEVAFTKLGLSWRQKPRTRKLSDFSGDGKHKVPGKEQEEEESQQGASELELP